MGNTVPRVLSFAVFTLSCVVPVIAQESLLPSRSLSAFVVLTAAATPAQQLLALERWTRDYAEYASWLSQWRNRVEPGWFSAKARRVPPVPPEWLAAACAQPVADSGPLAEACAAWREWDRGDSGASVVAAQSAKARTQHEATEHTQWWERVHLDALWPMTRSGTSAFGVAGVHTTMAVGKRFQVFLTPGVILMRAPSIDGSQTFSAGTTWGFSFNVVDFRMPLTGRPATLHINMARVWLLGSHTAHLSGDLYLTGFSLTFKKR